jgi:hypothetical protein
MNHEKKNSNVFPHFKGNTKHHDVRNYFKVENDKCKQGTQANLEIPMPNNIFSNKATIMQK